MSRYSRLKEQGLCVRCGKNPVAEGKVECQECRDKRAKYAKEAYYIKKMASMNDNKCVKCGKEKEPDRKDYTYCRKCAELEVGRVQEYRIAKSLGLEENKE